LGDIHTVGINNLGGQITGNTIQVGRKADSNETVWLEHGLGE
jgi:hypothetical protein